MKYISVTVLLLCTLSVLGQSPSWQWASIGNDGNFGYGSDVAVDDAGNVYVTGNFTNTLILDTFWLVSAGGADIFIAKYSPSGQCLWLKQAGGAGDDKGISIAIDEYDHIYLYSNYSGTAQYGNIGLTSVGGSDLSLAKYDSSGIFLWARTWGSINDDLWQDSQYQRGVLYGMGVFTKNGPLGVESILLDSVSLTSHGDADVFILKVDTAGAVLWAKNEGAKLTEIANGLTVDRFSNFYVSGTAGTTIRFDNDTILNPGALGVNFVVKYDSSGTQLWSRGAFSTHGYYGGRIATSSSGSVYMTGYTVNGQWISFGTTSVNNTLGNSSFLAKYSSSGSILWAKKIPDLSFYDSFEDIRIDANDDIYLTGRYSSLAVFGSDTFLSKGHDDILVVKLDSNGNYLWGKSAGGSTNDGAHSCALLPDGSVVTTGYVSSATAYFDNIQISAVGYWDTYVAKVSANTAVTNVDTAANTLHVFPNPTSGTFTIATPRPGTLILMDITGRLVKELTVRSGATEVTMPVNTEEGMYLLSYIGFDGWGRATVKLLYNR